ITFLNSTFAPDGKFLAFPAYDKKAVIRIIDLETKKQAREFETKSTHHIAFSGDGRLMLGADFTRIEVWDFVNGKRSRELEDVPETSLPVLKPSSRGPWLSYTIRALEVSPDGKLAAAAFTRMGSE